MFFNRLTGLLRNHPGCEPLEQAHLREVRRAIAVQKVKNGGKGPAIWNDSDQNTNNGDPAMGRLLWLEYWMAWALKDCENPALYNS